MIKIPEQEQEKTGLTLEVPEEQKSIKQELIEDLAKDLFNLTKIIIQVCWSVFTFAWVDDIIRANLISKEHVLDKWSILIKQGQGNSEKIFEQAKQLINESQAPSLILERRDMRPGIIKGLLGEKREFLVVRNQTSKLKSYQIFISVRDYGNNLDVSWYLTYRLSFLKSLLNAIPFVCLVPATLEDLDLFNLQDLTSYVTVCHYSLLDSVEKLMKDLNQDPSKIDRKTRGFLGIS